MTLIVLLLINVSIVVTWNDGGGMMDWKKELDKWWDTEPFGWDNPDTYNGIEKLMEKLQEENKSLKDKLDMACSALQDIGEDREGTWVSNRTWDFETARDTLSKIKQ